MSQGITEKHYQSAERSAIIEISEIGGAGFQEVMRTKEGLYSLENGCHTAICINLVTREDRWRHASAVFQSLGIEVERLEAIDGSRLKQKEERGGIRQYACQLSHRIAIRRAKLRATESVLIFEDDVLLDPDVLNALGQNPPPKEWGVIFLGGTHVKTPTVAKFGWVKVRKVWGTHAYAVRKPYYGILLKALRRPVIVGEEGVDNAICRLADQIPMYAAYPNLAWQSEGYSDIMQMHRNNYDQNGRQTRFPAVVRKIEAAMVEFIHSQDEQGVVES